MIGTCIGERNHCRFWFYLLCETIALCVALSTVRVGVVVVVVVVVVVMVFVELAHMCRNAVASRVCLTMNPNGMLRHTLVSSIAMVTGGRTTRLPFHRRSCCG